MKAPCGRAASCSRTSCTSGLASSSMPAQSSRQDPASARLESEADSSAAVALTVRPSSSRGRFLFPLRSRRDQGKILAVAEHVSFKSAFAAPPQNRVHDEPPVEQSTGGSLVSAQERLAYIDSKRTVAGGFTRADLAEIGVAWPPPRGWRKALRRAALGDASRHQGQGCVHAPFLGGTLHSAAVMQSEEPQGEHGACTRGSRSQTSALRRRRSEP